MTQEKEQQGRPFLGVMFQCCKIYSRIYMNKDGSAYVGWCPRCAKPIRIKIDPRGSSDRFFEVS